MRGVLGRVLQVGVRRPRLFGGELPFQGESLFEVAIQGQRDVAGVTLEL